MGVGEVPFGLSRWRTLQQEICGCLSHSNARKEFPSYMSPFLRRGLPWFINLLCVLGNEALPATMCGASGKPNQTTQQARSTK